MPAKWPNFIKNVSAKLESRDAKSIPKTAEFAKFLANEYVSAVKTAQTPFGNTHKGTGQKPILEQGFIKAFNKLYSNYYTSLEDRRRLEKYASVMEVLPKADLTFDADCEIEKWTLENIDKEHNFTVRGSGRSVIIKPFNFYPLFESTCPVPYPEENPNDLTGGQGGDIDFSVVTKASSDINAESHNYVVRFILSKFDKEQSYKIKYTLNGEIQPLLTIGSGGFVSSNVPAKPGKYAYKFLEILDASGKKLIKEVNKTKSITISDGGVLEKLSDIDETLQGDAAGYPEVIERTPRKMIPDLTEEETINVLVNRILLSNDGTRGFKLWVDQLETGSRLSKKVYSKLDELEKEWRKAERSRLNKFYEEKAIEKYGTSSLRDSERNTWSASQINIELVNAKVKKVLSDSKNKFNLLKTFKYPNIPGEIDSINRYIFQEEHSSRPKSIPAEITRRFITDFTYVASIDKSKSTTNNQGAIYNELQYSKSQSDTRKKELWKKEQKRWWNVQIAWAKYLEKINKQEQGEDGEDPYEIMAGAIIAYWQSTAVQPFTSTPPIPPCAITAPFGGIYTPIYYGSKPMLANDLRRAWNSGKFFEVQPANPVACKLVASAVASSCAKHLLLLKFLYLGGIPVPPSAKVPMIGFVPVVF